MNTDTNPETAGERIAREFSANKVHLAPTEQRRLAAMIDGELTERDREIERLKDEAYGKKVQD